MVIIDISTKHFWIANINHRTIMGYFFWNCSSVRSYISPQIASSSDTVIYPLNLDGKILLLKITHNRFIDHKIFKMVLTWKILPYYLSCLVLKVALHTPGGEY